LSAQETQVINTVAEPAAFSIGNSQVRRQALA